MQKRVVIVGVLVILLGTVGFIVYARWRGRLNSSADQPLNGIVVDFAQPDQHKDAQFDNVRLTEDGRLQLAPETH